MRKTLAALLLACTLLIYMPTFVFSQSGGATQAQGNPSVKVWVNTPTHIYHCPGTRYYGKTKNGAYLTQKEALDQGNQPANGKYCQ